jgi:hypothetical protein
MLSTKEDYQELLPGNLGALVKGKKRIKVPGRDGFVYVRLRSTNSEIVQAFNDKVAYIYGLDVVVARDKWANKRYVVVSRDLGRYDEWGGGVSVGQLAPHGYQHSFGKDDPVWVYKQQFMPLLVSPLTTTSVKISSDYYLWEGAYKFYSGSSVDLSANIPIVVGYSKFVTLYLDGTTNSVQQVVGTDFLSTGYTGDIASYIPTISSDQGIALGAVVLNFGQSQITWRNIYDIRPLWTGKAIQYPPGSLYIYDDGVLKGTGTSIDFAYGLDVTMVGSRAYVDLSYTIRDDGVLQTSRPSLDFVGTGFSVYDSPSATIVSGTSAAIVQGDMTATSPIAVDQTRQVIGGAVVLSHVTTPGNIHLPSGGSAGQYLGYGGSSGVGTWTDLSSTGTVASVPAASVQIQGALATGTSAGAYIAPTTGTITACYIYCKTKGSANNTIVDVHKNGTTIFTNQANRPSLAWNDGDGVAKSGVPDVVALVENDLLTFFIDAIATGAEDLTIVLAVDLYMHQR